MYFNDPSLFAQCKCGDRFRTSSGRETCYSCYKKTPEFRNIKKLQQRVIRGGYTKRNDLSILSKDELRLFKNKRHREYMKNNIEKRRKYSYKFCKERIKNLPDYYIIQHLGFSKDYPKNMIPKELIELKRAIIVLNRKTKEMRLCHEQAIS